MILKKFIGKTLEAAKKSAQQIYGDDFVVLETVRPEEDQKASITVIVDGKKRNRHKPGSGSALENLRSYAGSPGHSAPTVASSGVTTPTAPQTVNLSTAPDPAPSGGSTRSAPLPDPAGETVPAASGHGRQPGSRELYSRAAIRRRSSDSAVSGPAVGQSEPEQRSGDSNGRAGENRNPGKEQKRGPNREKSSGRPSLLSRFDATTPRVDPGLQAGNRVDDRASSTMSDRRGQREITALHKRFDKIEALLDSALVSSSFEFVSHPAFQQLVHTGIGTTVVAGWFSRIIRDGVDPYEQSGQFMSRLSAIIRDAVDRPAVHPAQKYLLFTGPSGSGKTQIIQKLLLHAEILADTKRAVLTLYPAGDRASTYYSIMEPFCKDREIPCFRAGSALEVNDLKPALDKFDHVLIDTPSIRTQQDDSFREYWNIRQSLSALTPMEVHFVVNASLNHYYFRQTSSTHHPLQPDYVSITHLDEVQRWGPIIPFLQEIGCAVRYVSTGTGIPESVATFDPEWFARHLLHENKRLPGH